MATKSSTTTGSTSRSLLDVLKPRRSEAVARLRSNGIGLIILTVLTNLLPLPSLWTSFRVVWGRVSTGRWWWYLCASELLLVAIFSLNMLQSLYALSHPPTSRSTPSTLSKPTPKSPPTPQWRLSGLTPNSKLTPQKQKAFSASTSAYIPSPISTPSRTINYIPPSVDSSFDDSVDSSLLGSPSPIMNSPLAAYKGRHSPAVGRAFEGSLLNRLIRNDSDNDD